MNENERLEEMDGELLEHFGSRYAGIGTGFK